MATPTKTIIVILYLITAAAASLQAQSMTTLYDITFDDPIHTIGQPPACGPFEPVCRTVQFTHKYNNIPHPPTVVEAFGGLNDRPCLFEMKPDQTNAKFQMIGLEFFKNHYYLNAEPPHSHYRLEMDLLIESLAGYADELVVSFGVGNIFFGSDQILYIPVDLFNGIETPYTFGDIIHLVIDMDFTLSQYTVSINDDYITTVTFRPWNDWDDYWGDFNNVEVFLYDEHVAGNRAAIDNLRLYGMNDQPELSLIQPSIGKGVTVGKSCPITWYSSSDVEETTDVLIEYSIDDGHTWTPVSPPNTGNTGMYQWMVPNSPSNGCRLRLTDPDLGIQTHSDVFRICPPIPELPPYDVIYLDEIMGTAIPTNTHLIQNDLGDIALKGGHIIWLNGEIIEFDNYEIVDMNNQREVLLRNLPGMDAFFYIWQNDEIIEVVPLANGEKPLALNDSRTVLITNRYNWTNPSIWMNGTRHYMELDERNFSKPENMNNLNQVTGIFCSGEDESPFLWSDGTLDALDLPAEMENSEISLKSSVINNAGTVACSYLCDRKDVFRSLLWENGNPIQLEPYHLLSLNDTTQYIMLSAFDPSDYFKLWGQAYLVHGGEKLDLRQSAGLPPTFYLADLSLNNNGWVTAVGINAVRLDPPVRPLLFVPRRNRQLQTISILGPQTAIYENSTVSFRAVGIYNDKVPVPLTDQVVWTIDPPSAGVISPAGLLQVMDLDGIDEITVTAQYAGDETLLVSRIFPAHFPRQLYVPAVYPTIQAAIDAADDGDTILIADGIYTGPGNRDIDFLGKAITVQSENGPENCIIDCQGTEADPHRAFIFQNGETNASALSGFTVINGYANFSTYLMDDQTVEGRFGGAIFSDNASPVISNCIIEQCRAEEGGGGFFAYAGSPVITGSIFRNNQGAGAAIYAENGVSTVRNCQFISNDSKNFMSYTLYNGIMWGFNGPGALLIANGSANISSCDFIGNRGMHNGGLTFFFSEIRIDQCKFVANIGQYWSCLTGFHYDLSESYQMLNANNCIFEGNKANFGVLWLSVNGIKPEVYGFEIANCTFTENTILTSSNIVGAIGLDGPLTGSIVNSILTDSPCINTSPQAHQANITIEYSNIRGDILGDWTGIGNIDLDPEFVNPGHWDGDTWVEGDYHLQSTGWRWDTAAEQWTWDDVTSPCIDAGNPGMALGDEPVTLAVDPLNRWSENVRINMGAYGGTPQASMAPPGWALLCDLDNSGRVDLADLAPMAAAWLHAGHALPPDVTRDGTVDLEDVAQLAAQWLQTPHRWTNEDIPIPGDGDDDIPVPGESNDDIPVPGP